MEEAEEKYIENSQEEPSQGLDNWEEWKENNLEDWQKERAEKDKKETRGCLYKFLKVLLITIGIIVFLFLTGILSYTTESCDLLPFDILLFNNVCILSSAVFTVGGSAALGLAFGAIGLIFKSIELLFTNKKK